MAISFKIHPRKDFTKKDGTSALYLWVRIDRKLKKYALPYSIDPEKWDWSKNLLRGSNTFAQTLNTYITSELGRLNIIAVNISNSGKELNFDTFDNEYLKAGKDDYYEFVNRFIEKNKGRLSPNYLRQHRAESTKLQKFRSILTFQDINHQFLSDYEYYMRNELNNTTNTVYKSFKRMKSIINEAMIQNEKLYTRSPFVGYKLRTEPTSRLFLSSSELNDLYAIKDEFNDKIKNVLQYFLFSCFTGLRYQDIADLTWRSVATDRIEVKMHKTKDTVIVPLLDKAKNLLPETGNLDDQVFRVLSNQKTNDYLKLAIEKAGINKNITFHCARHTFATVALNSGIPLEVVQKLLGHSMIRTTQIYSKVLTETLFQQMEKMK
ncbi:MAG: site-specific integrase [Bacteroidales bacterium]|nr:site-specific integrase [Bacteroidales bacterium]